MSEIWYKGFRYEALRHGEKILVYFTESWTAQRYDVYSAEDEALGWLTDRGLSAAKAKRLIKDLGLPLS